MISLLYVFFDTTISGELKKLNISVSHETVRKVIQNGRREGEILPNGSWKKFIKSHLNSLFCCDFLTVETVFNLRIYIFFILEMKTRKIIQFGITNHPDMRFVRNQLTSFMFDRIDQKTYLIHDNSGELKWTDYKSLDITDIAITPYSPNMNAFAERFVRSVKYECFDNFIVMNIRHARNLMKQYVNYYNYFRPHQGIDNNTPVKSELSETGKIRKEKVFFGLYTNYYRSAS